MEKMNTEYFLSINDVAKRLDLPAHTLRYWEKQFPAAIKPTTGAGGRRYYRTETVAMLENIKHQLYNRGMTIAGVKKLIKEGGFTKTAEPEIVPEAPAMRRVAQSKPEISVPKSRDLFSDNSGLDDVIDLLERARKILK